MNKQSFRKIQKILSIALAQAEKEAIDDGVDIRSEQYDQALSILREKILNELGLTIESYEELRKSFKIPKKPIDYKELINRPEPQPMPETLTPEAIEVLIKENISQIPIQKPQIINNIVKETIKEKPQIIKTIEKTREIKTIEKLDTDAITELRTDLTYLQKEFQRLPTSKDWTTEITDLTWRIDNFELKGRMRHTMADAGSFNTAILDSRYYKKSEVDALVSIENLFDRTATVLSPHTAGDSLDMGTGAITTTGLGTFGSLKATGLTSGRIPYVTTGGLLTDSANFTFDGSKAMILSQLGIGDSAPSYTNLITYKAATDIGTTSWFGMYSRVDSNATVNGTNYIIGVETNLYSSMAIAAGVTDLGYRVGMRAQAFPGNTSFAGTLSNLYGFWTRAGISAASSGAVVTNSYSVYADILNNAAGTTIGNAYGVYINTSGSAGTITNWYDLYASDTGARNYLAGNTAIGGLAYNANKLDIVSTNRSTAFDASNGATWHDVIIYNSNTTQNAAVGLVLKPGTYHSNAGVGIAAVKNTGDVYNADLVFITRPTSAVAAERMRIDMNGKVGINTIAPIEKLDIQGTMAYDNASSATITSGNTSVAVTFPTAFAGAPIVVATPMANVSCWVTSITTTGCTINIGSAAGTGGVVVNYIAIRET